MLAFGWFAHRAIEADIEWRYAFLEPQTEALVRGPNGEIGFLDVLIPPDDMYEIKPWPNYRAARADLRYYKYLNPKLNPRKYLLDGDVNDPPPLVGVSIRYLTKENGVILYLPYLNAKGVIIGAITIALAANIAQAETVTELTVVRGAATGGL